VICNVLCIQYDVFDTNNMVTLKDTGSKMLSLSKSFFLILDLKNITNTCMLHIIYCVFY